MRVLLIYPCAGKDPTRWMPLGLAFIAAELRRSGHAVAIFDRHAAQVRRDLDEQAVDAATLEQIARFRPDVIGLSTISPLIYDTVKTAALIRPAFSGAMVAGGYHATGLPELTLHKIPALDAVFTGEGEIALTRFASGQALRDIPGVWWRDEGQIQPPAAPSAQIANLDDLAQPALDLMDMPFYTERTSGVIRWHKLKAATLITSRGCHAHCTFCAESLTYGRGVRWHSAAYVLEWIERVIHDYGVDGLHFHDNDWLADEARAREICAGLIRRGWRRRIRWSIQARADRITADLARLIKSAGCALVEIGVEVGTQAELNRIGKGTTVPVMDQAVKFCREAGLEVHAYMLTQTENETIADLEARLAWLKRNPVTSVQWSPLSMYPGTALYKKRGGDFFAKSEWTKEAIDQYYAADAFSSIPPAVRREWMTRNYIPFFRQLFWWNVVHHTPLPNLARFFLRKLLGRVRRMAW